MVGRSGFVDNLYFMTHQHTDMEQKLEELNAERKKVGLKINEGKTATRNQVPIAEVILNRKYGWTMFPRPKNTWKKIEEREMRTAGKSWREVKKMAQNRVRWRSFIDPLRPLRD